MSSERAREHWDQQAPVYASDAGQRGYRRFLDLYEESCWRYIEPTLPQVDGSMVLETGCGTGRWVYRLAPMGYQMVLSDLSPEMIRAARDRVQQQGLSDRVESYHVLDICDMHGLTATSFDLVLALGGPLTLAHDAGQAVDELYRLTKPGGHVICDTANRYRTALDLVRDTELSQLVEVLDTGRFARPDGLTDHRFSPQELADLFEARGMAVLHVAGICPFFDFLPSREQVSILDAEAVSAMMQDVSRRYAQDPFVVGLSGRLLIVAEKAA